MVKDKKDIRPVLVKLGVALALSFAGFLYSRIKCRRPIFSQPPCSPNSSGLHMALVNRPYLNFYLGFHLPFFSHFDYIMCVFRSC